MNGTWLRWRWYVESVSVTWLTHVCDMTCSCVWHDTLMCVTWLTHLCDTTHSCVWRDIPMCVTWITHMGMCDMKHSYVWHDLLLLCDMNPVWHESLIYLLCDMNHSYVWHDITHGWVTCDMTIPDMNHFHSCSGGGGSWSIYKSWLIFVCDMTHICVWHDSFLRVT